jgi:hypothetical protein
VFKVGDFQINSYRYSFSCHVSVSGQLFQLKPTGGARCGAFTQWAEEDHFGRRGERSTASDGNNRRRLGSGSRPLDH